jgi:hypothetical protein
MVRKREEWGYLAIMFKDPYLIKAVSEELSMEKKNFVEDDSKPEPHGPTVKILQCQCRVTNVAIRGGVRNPN